MTIGAGHVAAVSLRTVERRVGQFNETNRVASVIREAGDANTHRETKTSRAGIRCFSRCGEDRLLDSTPHALRRHQALQVIRVQQERRSEEHTSELQSQSNLVCRLLLEKKKIKQSVP